MKVYPLESPALKTFTEFGAEFSYRHCGDSTKPVLLWGHGWGQDHASFRALIQSLEPQAHHIALDFPGFGQSPMPPGDWSTEEYADAIAAWIKTHFKQPVYWAGHSFGGRVGLQLAARHPDNIAGLFIIAGAGLQRKRSAIQTLHFKMRRTLYKFLKRLRPFGLSETWLRNRFGSADYLNAGQMREIFTKVIQEDLTSIAQAVRCKTYLFFGQNDTETPPEFGTRFESLIPNSELYLLDGEDHYTVLSSGRHMITSKISAALKKAASQQDKIVLDNKSKSAP